MSELILIEQLKFLVKTREQISQLKELIDSCATKVKEKQEQLNKFEKVLNFEKNNFSSICKAFDLCELEAKTIQENEAERKALLESETKETVRKAIFSELKSLENLRLDLEYRLESLWAEKEKTQRNLSMIKEDGGRRLSELESELAELVEEQNKFLAQLPALELENKNFLNTLRPEWRERLESMSEQSNLNLIAAVNNGLCGACFYPISSRDIGELLKSSQDIIECKSCFRLLYFEPKEKTEEDDKKKG